MNRFVSRATKSPERKFEWLQEKLDELDANSLRRRLIPRDGEGQYLLAGKRRLINFGANDYLGIAMSRTAAREGDVHLFEQRIKKAKRQASQSPLNLGATASALVCGFSTSHERLCQAILTLEQTAAAVLFPSGFAACCGTIVALAEPGDLIFSDALNHASLIDGCRLSKAERFIYPNRDTKAVAALLSTHRGRFRRAFIVTDTIFSMDGTRAPLGELADLADHYDAILIVDEAHATGVLGSHGGGLCDELGVSDRVPLRIGTLSKALGAQGGFAAGPSIVIDYLLQAARPLIFSTAFSPATAQAALDAFEVVQAQPERRERVLMLAERITSQLREGGQRVIGERTPIVPLIIGDAAKTLQMAAELDRAGFYIPAIRPPTVPKGSSRLRISLSAAHTDDAIESLIAALQSHR